MKKLTLVLSMLIALVSYNANAAMYIVGNNPFGDWHTYAGAEMTDNGDGVYTYVTDQITGTVWFVFADNLTPGPGDDWNTFNGNYRYGPLTSGQAISSNVEYTTQKSTNGNVSYNFEGAAGQSYQFTFDTNTMKFKVEGYVPPVEINTYSVAGEPAAVFGETWNEKATATEMTLVDGLYTWTKDGVELSSGTTIAFKVVGNHDWGHAWPSDNYTYDITESGTYNLVFTIDPETKEVGFTATKVQDGPVVDPITGDLFMLGNVNGNGWAGNVGAEMTTADEDIYTLTDAIIADSGDGYGYFSFSSKLGENADDWSFAAYRRGAVEDGTLVEDGVQAVLADWGVANAFKVLPGTYDVEVGLSSDYVTLTKKGEVPIVEDTYTVAGTENLFVSNWNEKDETNDMVKGEDGIYTWTKSDVVFEDVDTIQFKVVKNHSWDNGSWPQDNWWHRIATAGTYDFVITFDPAAEADNVTFTVTKQGGEEPVEMVYTVVGPENIFGTDWNPEDTNNDMTKGEDGNYTWTKEEVSLYGNFEFKVIGNHDYAIYEWPIGMNNWVANVAEEGIYTIEIIFNPEAEDAGRIVCNLTKTGDVEPVEHVYTVAGTENVFGSNWNEKDETNDMEKGEDGIYTWSKKGVALAAEEEVKFKVVQDHAWTYAWPSNDWYFKAEEEGLYDIVITFDPTADDMNKITFTATKQGAGLRGDVNNDHEVNISDAIALINAILNSDISGINTDNANVNGDDDVNISDAIMLINYVLNSAW